MSPGTALFTANGFTSGSVNRPWHTSRPTAAASTWIMHGGKFKNDFRLRGGFTESSAFRQTRRQTHRGLLQELKYFCPASSSKHSCLTSLCSLQHVSSAVYSWLYLTLVLYLYWCTRTQRFCCTVLVHIVLYIYFHFLYNFRDPKRLFSHSILHILLYLFVPCSLCAWLTFVPLRCDTDCVLLLH